MTFFARRIVIALAFVSSVFTYLTLRQFAWAFDAAIVVGYTVMVLGDGLTAAFLKGHTLAGQKWTAIALTHICFLAVVVGVARLMYYLKMTDDSLPDKRVRSYYDLVAIAIAVVLGLVERTMLFRPKEEKQAKATA